MRVGDVPFSRLDESVLSLSVNRRRNVAVGCVRLSFNCTLAGRKLAQVAEIAMKVAPDVRRGMIKRMMRHLAWQNLSAFYDGHDPVDHNLFLVNVISDAEEQALYRNLTLIEVEEVLQPLDGRLLRWVNKDEALGMIAAKLQNAA